MAKVSKGNFRHGLTRTPAWVSWREMKTRCLNPKRKDFSYYGGAGITLTDEWMEFENFFRDMGQPPKGYTLDRIDTTKGYSKENCRWASREEQSRNRSYNKNITWNGKTMTTREWERELNLGIATVSGRIKRGWTIEEALTTPVKRKKV